MMDRQMRVLQWLLVTAVAGELVLLYALVSVGNRVRDVEAQLGRTNQFMERSWAEARTTAAEAAARFREVKAMADQVNRKMDRATRQVKSLDAQMARAEARMAAAVGRQINSAEARMKWAVPRVIDAYVAEKIRMVRRAVGGR